MFALFKPQNLYEQDALRIYALLLEQTRRTVFYERYGVPDTLDGRFDLLVLHVFLYLERLISAGEVTQDLRQALFDVMFADMDQSLRESGIGDMGVPKHMKRMMTGFNGRMHAYAEALASGVKQKAFEEALRRNLYATAKDVKDTEIAAIKEYVYRFCSVLQEQNLDDIMTGKAELPHG